MWEKPRVDGKRKLKDDAEPTIFYSLKKNPERFILNCRSTYEDNCDPVIKPVVSSVPSLSDYHQLSPEHNTNNATHDDQQINSIEVLNATHDDQQINSIEVLTSNKLSGTKNEICEETNSMNNENPYTTNSRITSTTLDEALKTAVLKTENLEKQLKEANAKLQAADVNFRKILKSNNTLLRRIRQLKSKNRIHVEKSLLKSSEILHKVFNNDQIKWLQHDSSSKRLHKWSEQTIKKALRIKVSCSESGYRELMKQNIPLPSSRTLRRRLETIKFEPGICDDIFEALKEKVEQFEDDRQRDCMLALDEMGIEKKFIETLELSSDIVQFEHLKELVAEQKDYHFKLVPKLHENVIKTTTFNKMKVNMATNMLNRN
ncbi:thap domain-containing protein 4, partial [Lasius niger]